MRAPLAIILLTFAASAFAGTPPPIHKDQLFLNARKALLKAKWQPVHMPRNTNEAFEGVEKQLAGRGINEFDSCSIDSSRCILYYKKKHSCLRVDAVGEQLSVMKVVQWAAECPDMH